MIISYFGSSLSKSNSSKAGYIVLWAFCSGFTMTIAILMTNDREELYKKLQSKCPQLEKIENAYRIK
jgi:broad-specificity NMP kinase